MTEIIIVEFDCCGELSTNGIMGAYDCTLDFVSRALVVTTRSSVLPVGCDLLLLYDTFHKAPGALKYQSHVSLKGLVLLRTPHLPLPELRPALGAEEKDEPHLQGVPVSD